MRRVPANRETVDICTALRISVANQSKNCYSQRGVVLEPQSVASEKFREWRMNKSCLPIGRTDPLRLEDVPATEPQTNRRYAERVGRREERGDKILKATPHLNECTKGCEMRQEQIESTHGSTTV
ncbi:hypothetical protein TNCV_5107731 [Trichonephila clavipes]|nr:hypothetical protein TNCV_5107731 [Trichonephila clavipes]